MYNAIMANMMPTFDGLGAALGLVHVVLGVYDGCGLDELDVRAKLLQ